MNFDIETVQNAFGIVGQASESVTKLVGIAGAINKLISNSEAGSDPEIKAAMVKLADELAEAKLTNISLKAELHEIMMQAQEAVRINDKLSRYALHEPTEGHFVLKLKQSESENEPTHYICQKCADKRKHIVLQSKYQGFGTHILFCPECESSFGTLRTEPYGL